MQKRIFRYWILISFLAYFFCTIVSAAEIETDNPFLINTHAILIGINSYDNWNDLYSPVSDVMSLQSILIEKYNVKPDMITAISDISPLTPSFHNIIILFENQFKDLKENDNMIVFFSGHSTEDLKGETYWIPNDAAREFSKDSKWLNHRSLCDQFFANPTIRAKHICILSDSVFNPLLFQPNPFPVFPNHPNYHDMLIKKSSYHSREIVSFNHQIWPIPCKNGTSLFSYYIKNQLQENQSPILALDHLISDSQINQTIQDITGSPIKRGRLKSDNDSGGQFLLKYQPFEQTANQKIKTAKPLSPPPPLVSTLTPNIQVPINKEIPFIHIVRLTIYPEKCVKGMPVVINVQTNNSANKVLLHMKEGKTYEMEGAGMLWRSIIQAEKSDSFTIEAYNQDDKKGPPKSGQLTLIKNHSILTNVIKASVNPQKGIAGNSFMFTAQTDQPAKQVDLWIDNTLFSMQGKGTTYKCKVDVDKLGNIPFHVVARNEENRMGQSQSGIVKTYVAVSNVIKLSAMPESGYVDQSFLMTAITNQPAYEVFLQLDSKRYAMNGSGTKWQLSKKVSTPGKKIFAVTAYNKMGMKGKSAKHSFSVKMKAVGIPDILSVALYPRKIYYSEPFYVYVETSDRADHVFFEIDGKKHAMKGEDTNWHLITQIDKIDTLYYRVIAINKQGYQGLVKTGSILSHPIPGDAIRVMAIDVSQQSAQLGQEYVFQAKTDRNASQVFLDINGKRYPMTGLGNKWSLNQQIHTTGLVTYSIVGLNKKGKEGIARIGQLNLLAGVVNIIDVQAIYNNQPKIGDHVKLVAKTDYPSNKVLISINNVIYEMEGAGTTWTLDKPFYIPGKKTFSVIASNINEQYGSSLTGSFDVQHDLAPQLLPDVVRVFSVTQDAMGYIGDQFYIEAETNIPANKALLHIEDTVYEMDGAGTTWHYLMTSSKRNHDYTIYAVNQDNQAGQPYQGKIVSIPHDTPLVHMTSLTVTPQEGDIHTQLTFTAKTNTPAIRVNLWINRDRYDMIEQDNQWQFKKIFSEPGAYICFAEAENDNNIAGKIKKETFSILPATVIASEPEQKQEPIPELKPVDIPEKKIEPLIVKPLKRFKENSDGTVTDHFTHLIWLKHPKSFPATYQEAISYCNSLNQKAVSKWRLPTIEEWQQLIDVTQKNPSLPKGHPFTNIQTGIGYWSVSNHPFGPPYVYQINLFHGQTAYIQKDQKAYVWPVKHEKTQFDCP